MPVCRVCQDARTKFDLENGRVGTTKKGENKRHTGIYACTPAPRRAKTRAELSSRRHDRLFGRLSVYDDDTFLCTNCMTPR